MKTTLIGSSNWEQDPRIALSLAPPYPYAAEPMRWLIPYDGSPASERAVEFAAALADAAPLAPVLLNVQAPPLHFWAHSISQSTLEAAQVQRGNLELERPRVHLQSLGRPVATRVRIGLPASAILEEVRSDQAAAIVMGTRGRGALSAFALGSVAARVAHRAQVPTFLVKATDRLPADARALRLCIAVDGSPEAEKALAYALQWSGELPIAELRVVHVAEPLTVMEAILPPHRDVIEQWSGNLADQATAHARDLLAKQSVSWAVDVVSGDPAPEIVRYAEQHASDLIVLGTRGLGAAHHVFIGSVVLKVAHASPVPAAIVS